MEQVVDWRLHWNCLPTPLICQNVQLEQHVGREGKAQWSLGIFLNFDGHEQARGASWCMSKNDEQQQQVHKLCWISCGFLCWANCFFFFFFHQDDWVPCCCLHVAASATRKWFPSSVCPNHWILSLEQQKTKSSVQSNQTKHGLSKQVALVNDLFHNFWTFFWLVELVNLCSLFLVVRSFGWLIRPLHCCLRAS